MRARLMFGRWETRNWSRRLPAASAGAVIAKSFCLGMEACVERHRSIPQSGGLACYPPLEHPHQNEKIGQLDGGFEELSRLEGFVQWSADPGARQRIRERHPPEMVSRFAIAAAGSKTTDTSDRVAECQAG